MGFPSIVTHHFQDGHLDLEFDSSAAQIVNFVFRPKIIGQGINPGVYSYIGSLSDNGPCLGVVKKTKNVKLEVVHCIFPLYWVIINTKNNFILLGVHFAPPLALLKLVIPLYKVRKNASKYALLVL